MSLPNAPFYRRWSFILAGVIGLAAITALLGWRGLQQVDPPATTTTLPTTTIASPTTTTPPPSIGPTSKPTSATTLPTTLWDIQSGKGTATSDGFRAPAAWHIEWSFDCSNFKELGGGNFKITGTGAFNQVDIQAVAVQDRGTQRYRGGGFGHLLVDSVCRHWSVTVLPD